jgi:hypothetical protein
MKQLLFLFLFLVPCLALAQYPSNGNQKITLGEQTTADGLIFRGVAATDTVRKPSIDTMAYMVLDTTTNIIWHYKKATSNAWLRVGGSITSGLTGVLPLANGGTGSTTQNFVDLTTTQSSIGGAKTFTSAVTATRFNPTANTATGNGMYLPATNTLGFSINGTQAMTLDNASTLLVGSAAAINNNFRINIITSSNNGGIILQPYTDGTVPLIRALNAALSASVAEIGTISGNSLYFNTSNSTALTISSTQAATFNSSVTATDLRLTNLTNVTDLRTDAEGDLYNGASDVNLKNNIEPITYGLNEVLKIKPVEFYWNKEKYNYSGYKTIGFIAQDLMDIIPNAATVSGDGNMQIEYTAIIATLTKAIQEQQALIKALEQRIINLENK